MEIGGKGEGNEKRMQLPCKQMRCSKLQKQLHPAVEMTENVDISPVHSQAELHGAREFEFEQRRPESN